MGAQADAVRKEGDKLFSQSVDARLAGNKKKGDQLFRKAQDKWIEADSLELQGK